MPARPAVLCACIAAPAALAQPFTVTEHVSVDVSLNGAAFRTHAAVTHYAGAEGWNGDGAAVIQWDVPLVPLPAPPWPILAIMGNATFGEPYLPGVSFSDASSFTIDATFGDWGVLRSVCRITSASPAGLGIDIALTGSLSHDFGADAFNPAGFTQRDALSAAWDFAAGAVAGSFTARWATAAGAASLPCTFTGTMSGVSSPHAAVRAAGSSFYSTCDPNFMLHFGAITRTFDFTDRCAADFNRDGFLDFFDYGDFVECFEGLRCPDGAAPDFNVDGFTDFFDYLDFVDAFEQGC